MRKIKNKVKYQKRAKQKARKEAKRKVERKNLKKMTHFQQQTHKDAIIRRQKIRAVKIARAKDEKARDEKVIEAKRIKAEKKTKKSTLAQKVKSAIKRIKKAKYLKRKDLLDNKGKIVIKSS